MVALLIGHGFLMSRTVQLHLQSTDMSTFPHVVVFTDFFSLTPETPQSSCSSQSCIHFMISHNLESLALYFQGVLPNVLPLAPLVIKVEEVGISGHQLLSQLVNCLSTPKLKKLSLYIDPRESAEDIIVRPVDSVCSRTQWCIWASIFSIHTSASWSGR